MTDTQPPQPTTNQPAPPPAPQPPPQPPPQPAPPTPHIPIVTIPITDWVLKPAIMAAVVGLIAGLIATTMGGVFRDALLGGAVAALAITLAGLLIMPWKPRKLNEVGPILLGSQMATFALLLLLGWLAWSRFAPHSTSYALAAAAGFLPALLLQAHGFSRVVARLAPPPNPAAADHQNHTR